MKTDIKWPGGKRFAFTVFDDTDYATVQNVPKVYDFLADIGMLTTKSVWPIKGDSVPLVGGATCDNPEYLQWVLQLKEQGFEIAMHNATYHTSSREQVLFGLEQFKSYFGAYPNIHVNHTGCYDGIYWGDKRLNGINRHLYNLLTKYRNNGAFQGSEPSSELFWGDKCKSHINYVRNFVYSDINTLKVCPYMPYHDKRRPYVNKWFASSEGANQQSFCKTIAEVNQERLEQEGGCCIMYTHFGSDGFYENGHLNAEFKQLMKRLSQRDGWFAPVSEVLDHIQMERGEHEITAWEHHELEVKWLKDKIFVTRGTS